MVGVATVVVFSSVVVSCSRPNPVMVKQLADLQSPQGSTALSKQTIGELKQEVSRYQGEVDKVFSDTQKLGRFYQMLGLKYFSSQMYGPALKSFKSAIAITPTNPVLFYMAGLCQAQVAKADENAQSRHTQYEQAAYLYENAVKIDGSYTDALYALSVVYVFELNEAAKAEPLLKKLLSLDSGNTNALFLLARVYVSEGHPQEAAKVYDQISSSKATAQQKSQAEANKKKVLEGAFGK